MNSIDIDSVLAKCKRLLRSDKFASSLMLLNEAISHYTDSRLFFARSVTYEFIGDLELAIADLDSAIALDPENAKYYFSRGSIYSFALEDNQQAILDFHRAVQLNPGHVEALQQLSICLILMGQDYLALDYATQALEIAPQDPVTLFCLGEAYLSLCHFDNAIDCLERAIQLDPNQEHFRKALARARQGKEAR